LTVSGNGIMPSFGTGAAPWYGYAAQIVEIEVQEGVTNVGRCAFYNLTKVTKVTLPEGLVSIDAYAFSGCKVLTEIAIPSTVTTIDPTAFNKAGVSPTV
ncbi:MAG: leucine-rich repeat domain-containing protein, partial [Clostridia bacterium]|nr:leucine-rich repeat domain-containing protein [Clostridia bacterium]